MYRLLLVDDEALIREAVSENVKWEQYGYEFAGSVENGEEALAFIEKSPVDVVFTDICMPYMDGIALSRELKKRYPSIKIIILSGYDDFEYAKQALHCGVKDYLLKPITALELGEVLTKLKDEMDHETKKEQRISQMKTISHRGQMILQSDMLYHLIVGSKTEEESRRELEKEGIYPEANAYRVGIVELDVYTKENKLEEVKKERALMAFVLNNVIEEIISREKIGMVCQGRAQSTFILFAVNKPVESRRIIKQICEEIRQSVRETMQLDVNIGLGGYVLERKDISRSYEEAEEAMKYHYVQGGNCIIELETVLKEKRQADMEELLNEILRSIRENDESGLRKNFTELKESMRTCWYDRRGIGMVLQRIADMSEDMSKKYDVYERNVKEEMLSEALQADEFETAAELLLQYCLEESRNFDSKRNVGGRKYAVLAMDYIEKNYADCSLSLQSVCSFLNISPSRFSSIIKAATGNTFMDALIGIRMQKARELLEHTDLKNYEIAEKVGFNDPHYFSTAFKRITGKSPTEYAKEARK